MAECATYVYIAEAMDGTISISIAAIDHELEVYMEVLLRLTMHV